MSILRPGGLELTACALNHINLKENGDLLDIGCGDGTAASYIKESYGQHVIGIDIDEDALAAAREKGVDARRMDAAMLDFDVCCFDTVLMECVFSILERQEEALHEAYCMLRPGGDLIISDLYCRQPDMDRWQQEYDSAMALFRKPRIHENCGKTEHIPSPYCQDGALVMKGLSDLLEELGLEVTLFEDHTEDLHTFAAQAIMDCGSLPSWLSGHDGQKSCVCTRDDAGYFLLIAHKKARDA